jgi:16S rRNA (cytosine1402-N4)-methyltransferase
VLSHSPVLLEETMQLLAPKKGEKALDVTLGLGGHSDALLKAIGASGHLTAIDADASNIALAEKRLEVTAGQMTAVHSNFLKLPDCLPAMERIFDVILADLGLSSPHLDSAERGFSFRSDVPLDMRFDQSSGMDASMLLASLDPDRLLQIFSEYGELPRARRFVSAIVDLRSIDPIRTTSQLVHLAKDVYGHHARDHIAQIFQALRIAVNQELDALDRLLELIPVLLAPGGRIAILSYHSLEDLRVKTAFRTLSTSKKDPITGAVAEQAEFILLTKKPITSSEEEIARNPRSRSARLRALERSALYTHRRSP